MDENGHVNFGSRPPADASESQKIELKNELDSVQVKISKNYAYCGDRPLPGPVNDPVGVLSGIKKQMPKWKEKLRETETGLAELTHRKLERQKKGLRGYDNSRWNERSRGLKRQADEYRCMIDWGSEQINRLAGTRQTILNAVDKLGADIAAEELARDKALSSGWRSADIFASV